MAGRSYFGVVMQSFEEIRTYCQRAGVVLVAVSKGQPVSAIQRLYNAGHRIFGENRVQELRAKVTALPGDIEWHLVGHLQTNKVRLLPEELALIQSVDSERLLSMLNDQSQKRSRPIQVLLQIRIAREQTKYGLSIDAAARMLELYSAGRWPFCRIIGLMGMATFTDDTSQIRKEFRCLRKFFESMQASHPSCTVLSMGMSADYRIAVEEGSTMVRIGTALFGPRPV